MAAQYPGKIFWKPESGEARQFPLKTLKVAAFLPREMSHYYDTMFALPLSSFKSFLFFMRPNSQLFFFVTS
jgi:hypothetical protein